MSGKMLYYNLYVQIAAKFGLLVILGISVAVVVWFGFWFHRQINWIANCSDEEFKEYLGL